MALTTNLISYYKLDEESGTTVNDELDTNDLLNTDADIDQAGKIGTSYHFDGTATLTKESSIIKGTSALSFSCWVYIDSASALYDVFSDVTAANGDLEFWIWNGKLNLRSYIGTSTNTWESKGTTAIAADEWTYIAVTKASGIDSDPTFYVDDDSETPTATYTGGKGRDAGVGLSISRKFYGKIDEAGYWSRA